MQTPSTFWTAAARRALQWPLLALAAMLAGCSTPHIEDFAQQTPALDLRQYFNGTLDAYGLFTDRSGKVIKRFTVVMRCRWDGDQGNLEEDFTYSDGNTQRRVWHLQYLGNGQYRGDAGDVVGGASGVQRGNALRWSYTLALPVDQRVWEVQLDDWMYLMSPQVMLNKARMSKWGVDLGEVTLSFVKRAP